MKYLFVSLLSCLFFSCGNEKKNTNSYVYDLETTEKNKTIALDSDVRYNAFYLYVFNDGGKEYLAFLNYRTNQILFYDFTKSEFLFKLNIESEGPDGVVQPTGLYIKDLDNIYVSSYAYAGLIKVDTTCRVVQKIPYGTTSEGYQVLPSYTPSSHPYIAPVLIDDKMYITQPAVERFHALDKTPLSVTVDSVLKKCEGLPLTYSILTKEELEANDTRFSRIFNGKEFIYSFYASEDIVVASVDHSDVKRVKVKSRYIDSPTEKQELSEKGPKLNLELARYGDLIYDSYRDVYYRFAYPKTELEDNIQWWGKSVYGRKKFSVIILDKDFHVIGETLFPEAIYNSYVFFVHKDGLYISRDYQMLYGNSEDYMTFELFNLTEKK
ncbi:DUF4221 family protein [Bacteroides fluxus]|jgi:hypothetical protein|uniref:Conserved domain protein n=1 Tax=Bacteroides fluxus YIT 12057 TaxID=763034 RepID=F3PTG5_9BACE|nr:DUF4221 family protein [Bacteroides fluxus]EGF56890.1 conserved domain protein [Bacteroides fluxus YIT 12057]